MFAGGAQSLDLTPEDECHLEQIIVGILNLLHVFQQTPAPAVRCHGGAQGAVECIGGACSDHHLLHQAAHGLTGLVPAQLGRRPGGHGEMAFRQNGQADFWKQLPAVESRQTGEIAALGTVETYRQHGCTGFGRDEGGAIVNLHQGTGERDAPFRENHHGPSRFHQPDDFLHRHRTGGIHRQVIHLRQQYPEHPASGDGGVHHEDWIDRQKQAEQQAVEKRLMIGNHEQPRMMEIYRLRRNFDTEQ